MSKSSKSRLYTAIGWAVFTIAKRTAKKRVAKVTPGVGSGGGGKAKKLLAVGAVAALVGGTAFAVTSSGGDQA